MQNEKLSLNPEICSFCKGKLKYGTTEFIVKVEKSIITIKDVPALICENCGEAYYEPIVSKNIDKVMNEFHKGILLVHPLAAGELEYNKVA